MRRVILLLFLLAANGLHSIELGEPAYFQEEPVPTSHIRDALYKIAGGALYFSATAAFGSAFVLSRLGWRISQFSPAESAAGNELFLFSHLCQSSSSHSFSHILSPKKQIPLSHSSWYDNHALLTQVPAVSDEEKRLVSFLDRRWLTKSTGFFPTLVDWVYPCFGVSVQVNPETTSHYARNPSNKISQVYQKTVDAWKKTLPHPKSFPLILTRPSDLKDYFPSYLDASLFEKIQTMVERLSLKMQKTRTKIVLDLTHIFPDSLKNSEEWMHVWEAYQAQLTECCKAHHINLKKVLCVQRLQQGEVGGLRLLPLSKASTGKNHRDYRFLLKWVSSFGLSANLLELDRFPLPPLQKPVRPASIAYLEKDAFSSFLDSLDQSLKSLDPQKTLMVKGTLQVLQGLLACLNEEKWNEVLKCRTRSAIALPTFMKIKEQFEHLNHGHLSFFEMASHLEQIHASISTLLEIFSPFTSADFPLIYRNLLTNIPSSLRPLTSCSIHSSAMTSMAGIFKAVEKSLGRAPRVLYGENTYFECIHLAEKISKATPALEATESDLQEVDLLISQFNPALKRIDLKPTEYHVEKITEMVNKILSAKEGKPLTLALDCTFDFIDSLRVGSLLEEFRGAIEAGILNVVCYRSGLKFDLFGMDNYSGAPFYMIHSQDAKWQAFDSLLTDPVLQSDRLSLNWFCLAYQNAAPQLELYRRQIFDNTRSLLNKIPRRLFDASSKYRVVPVEQNADIAFVDIKISGAFHQMRGAALVGGCLYIKSMEGGHPIFYRPSVGFYHPNFTMLFSKENTTIRLTLGLDPAQVDLLTRCFEIIDALNGAPQETLHKMLKYN